MKRDRWRLRAMLAAIVADPYRKLMAILLAIGLWLFINAQIRGETTRNVTLAIDDPLRSSGESKLNRIAVVLPTDTVALRRFMNGDHEIQSATVTLRGPRYAVDALENDPLDLQVSFSGLDWSTRREIEFTAANIRRDVRALEKLDIELDPPRIRVEVERIDRRELTLTIDDVTVEIADEELAKRVRLDTAEFQPPKAHILGPASAIARSRQPGEKPLIARVQAVGNERQVSARVELASGKELGLRLAEVPTVTFQLQPVTSPFTFELPLVIDDLALPKEQRGQYRADDATRKVRVLAGGQLLTTLKFFDDREARQRWAANNMRLLVVVPPPEPGRPLGAEIVLEARLLVLETSQVVVDRTERLLDEGVSVTLHRQQ